MEVSAALGIILVAFCGNHGAINLSLLIVIPIVGNSDASLQINEICSQ